MLLKCQILSKFAELAPGRNRKPGGTVADLHNRTLFIIDGVESLYVAEFPIGMLWHFSNEKTLPDIGTEMSKTLQNRFKIALARSANGFRKWGILLEIERMPSVRERNSMGVRCGPYVDHRVRAPSFGAR